MSDDYLFDGAGAPDPEVVRLEQMLGRLRTTTAAPPLPANVERRTSNVERRTSNDERRTSNDERRTIYAGVRFLGPALAVATAVVLMVGLTWQNPDGLNVAPGIARTSWQVSAVIGTPRIDAGTLVGDGRIAVGQTLITDAGSRAKMEVSDIGQVTVDEDTRVRLVETRDGRHRLALERGTLHAAIAAPPGQFIVTTPSATATDLGCIYSLHVDEDGSGMLSVEVGWVAFEERGREAFVPAGASSRTDRVNGPGTPRYDDTAREFRDAIDDIDHGGGQAGAALGYVLAHARGRDAMTLWHLIPRVSGADRVAVVDALASRVPPPADVRRDAVLRLDRAALDHWWDVLGLNEASWWRKWKQPLPSPAPPQAKSVPQIKKTVRLTVTGPGIGQPLEITERGVLTPFYVFGTAFFAGPADEPDTALPRYAVTFDIQTREGVRTGAYTFDYVRSRWTGDSFIYLPGQGDARYRANIRTIMRDGMDGAWHRASDAWTTAINPYLP